MHARAFEHRLLVHAEVNLVLCAGAEDHGVAEDAALHVVVISLGLVFYERAHVIPAFERWREERGASR